MQYITKAVAGKQTLGRPVTEAEMAILIQQRKQQVQAQAQGQLQAQAQTQAQAQSQVNF